MRSKQTIAMKYVSPSPGFHRTVTTKDGAYLWSSVNTSFERRLDDWSKDMTEMKIDMTKMQRDMTKMKTEMRSFKHEISAQMKGFRGDTEVSRTIMEACQAKFENHYPLIVLFVAS